MKLNTDSKIWHDFKNGESYALSHIYNQNIDFLFNYGKKFTTDEQLVLDVIQDLFCYLIEKKRKLGKADNIRMYLLKSFRRRLFGELYKNKKRKLNHKNADEPIIIFSVEEVLIKDEELTEKQLEIRNGLKKLNLKQREVLYYKFNCGMDYKEICEIMDVSYSSARQLVSRAVSTLKSHIKETGFFFFLIKTFFVDIS